MGVSSTTNTEIYAGDGVTVSFSFPFYFFSTTDLFVYIYDNIAGTITEQTLGTNYTVSGTANAQGLYPNGANVVFGSAPASTVSVVISRFPLEEQNFNILQNGTIPSIALIQQLDYLTLLVQSLQDQVNRCVQLPAGFAPTFNPNLPPLPVADTILQVNDTNDGLLWGASAGDIADAAAFAAAASASATAAAGSATTAAGSATTAAGSATSAAASAVAAAASAASIGAEIQEVPAGTINSSNTAFTLAHTPIASANVKLYQDGLFLRQGTDYTISGAAITMTTAPATGQVLDAVYTH